MSVTSAGEGVAFRYGGVNALPSLFSSLLSFMMPVVCWACCCGTLLHWTGSQRNTRSLCVTNSAELGYLGAGTIFATWSLEEGKSKFLHLWQPPAGQRDNKSLFLADCDHSPILQFFILLPLSTAIVPSGSNIPCV